MSDLSFIQDTLDKYGLSDRFDAEKALHQSDRRPGKRCKNGWIAADKKCSDDKSGSAKLPNTEESSNDREVEENRDGFKVVKGVADLKHQWGESLKSAISLSKKYVEVIALDNRTEKSEGILTGLKLAISAGAKTFKAVNGTAEMETAVWSVEALSSGIDRNKKERDQIVKDKGLDPNFKPSKMSDNIGIIDQIKKESKRKGAITGSILKDGKMEAAYVASSSANSPSLSLDYLASNPANFMGKRSAKGAGKQAILELIKISKKLGKGGSITLVPLDGAIGFYKKLGFEESSQGLLLSPENAAKLQSVSKRSDSIDNDSDEDFFLVSKDLRSDAMNIVFVQDTLDKYGLSDRLDTAETLLYLDSWRRLGPNARKLSGRSDSDDRQWSRWDSAIDRISIKYGLHLDDWKRLGPNQMGKPCGSGWVGLRGACKRGKKSEDNTAKIKESKAALADRIRARKGLSTIRSRNGRNSKGEWDVGAAFAPGKELQSSVMAKRTSPAKTKVSMELDRASRMMNKEEDRARINWGRSTGDWKQAPDSTAAMDMVKPKSRPTSIQPTPIESGKSLKSLFAEADRIGSKYQDEPTTLDERRSAKQGADKMLRETGVTATVEKSTGVASIATARDKRVSAGDKIRSIADKMRGEQDTQKVATGRVIQAAGKIWQNQENLIKEVATIANEDLDRKAAKLKSATESPSEASRRLFENAPVSIASSRRKSGEPRKRGRSVD